MPLRGQSIVSRQSPASRRRKPGVPFSGVDNVGWRTIAPKVAAVADSVRKEAQNVHRRSVSSILFQPQHAEKFMAGANLADGTAGRQVGRMFPSMMRDLACGNPLDTAIAAVVGPRVSDATPLCHAKQKTRRPSHGAGEFDCARGFRVLRDQVKFAGFGKPVLRQSGRLLPPFRHA